MINIRPSECEIYKHGNVTLLARDLCEKHGYLVSSFHQDSNSGKGSFVLKRTNDPNNQFLFHYHLPESERLIRSRLIQVMQSI